MASYSERTISDSLQDMIDFASTSPAYEGVYSEVDWATAITEPAEARIDIFGNAEGFVLKTGTRESMPVYKVTVERIK